MHVIQKFLGPNYFFWSAMKLPFPDFIQNMSQDSSKCWNKLIKVDKLDFLKTQSQHLKKYFCFTFLWTLNMDDFSALYGAFVYVEGTREVKRNSLYAQRGIGKGKGSMLLNFSDRTRSLCWLGYSGAEQNSQKKIQYLYVIQSLTVFPSFPIPHCAWREFLFTYFVPSTYTNASYRAEKSSIFNFGYVKQVWIRGLLGVKFASFEGNLFMFSWAKKILILKKIL